MAPAYKLSYFALRGLAETSRYCFAVSGTPYEDHRFPFAMDDGKYIKPEQEAAAASGALAVNMGRVPILYVDGKAVVGQSKSIERFLAVRFGLFGANDVEGAQIDMIGEHVRDIKDAYQKAKAAGTAEAFLKEELPKWLAKLATCCEQTGTPGFAVGNKLSLAGLQIYSLVCDFFDDKAAAAAAAKSAPAVQAIVDNVANNEKLKAWLAARPVTMF